MNEEKTLDGRLHKEYCMVKSVYEPITIWISKHDFSTGEHVDEEWDTAMRTGKRQSYWYYPYPMCCPQMRFVKSYTPMLAEVVRKRTGGKVIPMGDKKEG